MVIKRVEERIRNNLGVIRPSDSARLSKTYRSDKLKKYYDYMMNRQHRDKSSWMEAVKSPTFVPVRKRQPIITYPLPSIVVNRMKAKLIGEKTFPTFNVEEDPDTKEFIKLIHKMVDFKGHMGKVTSDLLAYGSAFLRFHLVEGRLLIQCYNPNYCYPKFSPAGEMTSMEVRYVFEKIVDGETKKFWYRLILKQNEDLLYDNPEYRAGTLPVFTLKERAQHNLGFVQGEWVKSTRDPLMDDGESLIKDILDFSDCMSYMLSMTDDGLLYSIEPQLVFRGLDTDELNDVVKSKENAWALGREGEANFLETGGSGIATALEVGKDITQRIQEVTRVIMHDPEKFSAHAQSGKALEVLNEPMVEYVDELRMYLEKFMISVTIKIMAVLMHYTRMGLLTEIDLNPTYTPQSLDISVDWQPVFPLTTQDLQQMVQLYTTLTNANIISRQTALSKIAPYFDIEDIEAEVNLVNTQQQFNTWGF